MSERHISQPAASTQEDIDELSEQLDRRFANERNITRQVMHQQPFNGSTKYISAMLTLLSMLVAAAISGEVVVYGQVQAMAREQAAQKELIAYIIQGHLK
jgi:hypothetical protein